MSQEWIWYRPDLFMEKVGAGPRKLENFLVKKKILIQDIAQEICATIDSNMYLCNDTINLIFNIDDKFKFLFREVKNKIKNRIITLFIKDGESFKMLLVRLEQDEAFRNEYIYKGLTQEKIFSWNSAAKTFTENFSDFF